MRATFLAHAETQASAVASAPVPAAAAPAAAAAAAAPPAGSSAGRACQIRLRLGDGSQVLTHFYIENTLKHHRDIQLWVIEDTFYAPW